MILSCWASSLLTTTPVTQMPFWNSSQLWVCQNCLHKKLKDGIASACHGTKTFLTFVTSRHLTNGSGTKPAILALHFSQSHSGVRSRLCHGNGKEVGLHVCQREPRAVLCFPHCGGGKFHSCEQDHSRARDALCALNVRFAVNPPLFESGFIKEPFLMTWLAG